MAQSLFLHIENHFSFIQLFQKFSTICVSISNSSSVNELNSVFVRIFSSTFLDIK